MPLIQLATLLGSGYWLNAKTFDDPEELTPKIGDTDASKVFIGVGALGALFFGGPIGAIGMGLVGSGLLNMNTRSHVEKAAEEWVKASLSMNSRPLLGPPAGRGRDKRRGPLRSIPGFVKNLLAA